ncbi:MAG: NHL domain-containing protein, partial [Armatimonadota bacterium]
MPLQKVRLPHARKYSAVMTMYSASSLLTNGRRVAVLGGALLCICSACQQAVAQQSALTIATVAGSGEPRLFGEGQPAVAAGIVMPSGLALDRHGNLYITDYAANRVLRVDAVTGIITTAAGNGPTELLGGDYWGDGGPAVEAALSAPNGIAIDAAGNIYIADSQNHRIRRIDPAGIITTVAGIGIPGYSGDGGPASEATLWKPEGIALDTAGNLYIADEANDRIRRVDALTGVITTVAGRGRSSSTEDIGDGSPAVDASLFSPTSVAVAPDGTLYIADSGNNRVRRVDARTGIITTAAGTGTDGFSGDGGPATEAQLDYPFDVEVTPTGDLLISDFGNHRIRRV